MSKADNYIFLPKFSLEPNKCTSYNEVYDKRKYNADGTRKKLTRRLNLLKPTVLDSQNLLVRSSHNFTLSDNAYRTLKRKINWLYYLSKAKYVKSYSGKEIFNFKIGFVTLTLSSKQKHPTKEVTALLFNQFLTEIRQRTNMENYVWRLEFQKNGNVHYHLVTDTYLDYFFVQKIWNRIQKSHGYLQDYTAKHSAMSLSDYYNAYGDGSRVDFPKLAKRYARGCQDKWQNPPSVDVKSVISNKAISNYIAKYFGKDAKNNTICNELDTPENSENLRLWFCSRSLSKLETFTDYVEAVEYNVFSIVETCKEVRKYVAKYATMYYFEIKKLPAWSRGEIEKLLRNYAFNLNYKPSL